MTNRWRAIRKWLVLFAKLKEEDTNYLARVSALANGATGYSCEGMAITVKHFEAVFARGDRAVMAQVGDAEAIRKP